MEKSSDYNLSLGPVIRGKAEAIAQHEGLTLGQLIIIAIADKIARFEHRAWMARRPRASLGQATKLTLRDVDVVDGDLVISIPGDLTVLLLEVEFLRFALEYGHPIQDEDDWFDA